MHDKAPPVRRHVTGALPACCMLVLLAVLAGSVHGDAVYRWVDAAGRVQFGDRPPPQGAELIVIPDAPPADSGADERRRRGALLGEILGEDRAARDAERRDERRAHLDRRARCESARQRLERTTRATVIYENSADPANPRVLNDVERNTLEQDLEAQVRRHCGGATPDP